MSPPKPLSTWLAGAWPWALAIFLGTFLLYVPSLSSGFVYDAETQILNDGFIHDAGNFYDVVTFRVLSRDVLDGTRPVHLFFLMTDALCWQFRPFGYHLTSIFIHSFNAALVFLLLVRLGKTSSQNLLVPALCTLVFAFHPVNVEAVAEVSDREDELATFFLLIGWWLAGSFGRWQRIALWLGGGAIVATGLLAAGAKETGFAAPFLLGLYWVLFRPQDPLRRWAVLLGSVFVVVAAFMIARFTLPPHDSQIFLHPPSYLGGSLVFVVENQPRLWAFLIKSICWPLHLSADYVPQDLATLQLPLAILILIVFVSAQAVLSWKSRLAFFGTAIFWFGLAPVSNFIPIYRPLADRFLYLPMVGIAFLLCAALGLVPARPFRLLLLALAVGVMALVALAWQRQPVFANSLNLWQDTLAKSPYSATAADNLGYAWLARADYQRALEAFQQALRLTSGHNADAWAGTAIAWEKLGHSHEAETALREAITADALYASPDKLVRSLSASRENAAILAVILARLPKDEAPLR